MREKGRYVLSSVHVGKGVCNAVESSGAKSQMESTCARGVCRRWRRSEWEEEKSAIGSSGSCAHRIRDFELGILFEDTSFFFLSRVSASKVYLSRLLVDEIIEDKSDSFLPHLFCYAQKTAT